MILFFEPVIIWRNWKVLWRDYWLYLFWLLLVPLTSLYGLFLATGGVANLSFLVTGYLAYIACTGGFTFLKYHMFNQFKEAQTYVSYYATSVDVRRLLMSEILWVILRTLPACGMILLVGWILGLAYGWEWMGMLVKAGVVVCLMGGIGLLAASAARGIEHIYTFEAIFALLYVLSGVFVKVNLFPAWLQAVVWLSPLYHAVEWMRNDSWVSLMVLIVMGVGSFWWAERNFRARVCA
jgi:lipooligosaccharide transport system permease protein